MHIVEKTIDSNLPKIEHEIYYYFYDSISKNSCSVGQYYCNSVQMKFLFFYENKTYNYEPYRTIGGALHISYHRYLSPIGDQGRVLYRLQELGYLCFGRRALLCALLVGRWDYPLHHFWCSGLLLFLEHLGGVSAARACSQGMVPRRSRA